MRSLADDWILNEGSCKSLLSKKGNIKEFSLDEYLINMVHRFVSIIWYNLPNYLNTITFILRNLGLRGDLES